jgi:hypothetical protein
MTCFSLLIRHLNSYENNAGRQNSAMQGERLHSGISQALRSQIHCYLKVRNSLMNIRLLLLLAATMMLGCAGLSADKPAAISEDGLVLVDNPNFAILYVRPDSDWSRYDSIYVAKPEIAFQRGWRASQNISDPFRITDRDENRIKEILSTEIVNVYGENLTRNSTFTLVTQPTDTTLVLKPEVVDLYVTAPADSSPYQLTILSENAGSMTIHIEVADASTGVALLRTSKRGTGRDYGDMRPQETVKNQTEGTRLLRIWAESLRAVINHERGSG